MDSKKNIMRKIFEKKIISETIESKIEELMDKVNDKMRAKNPKDSKIVHMKNPELGEGDVIEGNAFTGERCKAICSGKKEFSVDGKSYKLTNVSDKDRKDCGCETKDDTITISESDLINMISDIIEEEKVNGIGEVERVKKETKTESDKYLKDLAKKLKKYSDEFEMNPEVFPDRNKGEVKANQIDDEGQEFIDDFVYPGMENTIDGSDEYDNRLKDYVEGSNKTGNSNEYANSIKTDVNEKISKKIKRNRFNKEKKKSYNKDVQPVSNKIKEEYDNRLNEEFNRIQDIINYNKKTQ